MTVESLHIHPQQQKQPKAVSAPLAWIDGSDPMFLLSQVTHHRKDHLSVMALRQDANARMRS